MMIDHRMGLMQLIVDEIGILTILASDAKMVILLFFSNFRENQKLTILASDAKMVR